MDKEHFIKLLSYKGVTLKFLNITNHDDELSAVLIIHLLFEKIVERWVESITDTPQFFEGTPMTFTSKLQVAQNFYMPDYAYKPLITLNKIKDNFASDGSKENIGKDEMTELEKVSIIVKAHSPLRKLFSSSIVTQEGKKIYRESSNNTKLAILFTMLYQEIIQSVREYD